MNDASCKTTPQLRDAEPGDTLRALAKAWPYSRINREERHLAAILFHLINSSSERMEDFLKLFGIEASKADAATTAVYFEYALLRDIWHKVGKGEKANKIKRGLIMDALSRLKVTLPDGMDNLSVKDFNRVFRSSANVSTAHIESPSNWSVAGISKSFSDDDHFCSVCKFKWAFNIKPDIVIQIVEGNGARQTLCIEAKFESSESKYPSSKSDIQVFNGRGLGEIEHRAGQFELQKFMFNKVLGFNNVHFAVIQKTSGKEPRVKSWADVFNALTRHGLPDFMTDAISRASK